MPDQLQPKILLARLFYNAQLQFNALLLSLRSRQGFTYMLIVFRFLAFIAILARFLIDGSLELILSSIFLWAYLLAILAFVVLFYQQGSRLDNPIYHLVMVIIDLLAINYFIYLSETTGSELYLLLLLPLVTSAHFLPRKLSVATSMLVVIAYLFTLNVIEHPLLPFTGLLWFGRSAFMLAAAWLYRVQRNLPHTDETRIISPSKARNILEDLLTDLAKSVPYDTVSVQLLYRDQLQIVACRGFAHPEDVYTLEFPKDDTRFPNHLVIASRKPKIADPKDFPSFLESQFSGTHIKSWLGVPLLSPSTNECFGMISIDSSKPDAYTARDALRANWFAKEASRFLIEAALGPAAMTLTTKRVNFQASLKSWADLLPKKTSIWEDDLQAAKELSSLGQKIFRVEDCSIYFLRHHQIDSNQERLLHLVASSTIPPEFFNKHEIHVTGSRGDGLTGYAVHKDRVLNYSAAEIRNSPYHGKFTEHLKYLFSKRSRQIMIVPLHDSKGRCMGAVKVENKLGWSSDHRFLDVELNLFQLFAAMISLMLENIRQRNYNNRQKQSVHNVRAIVYPTALKPLGEILDSTKGKRIEVQAQRLEDIHTSINYTKSILDGLLLDSSDDLILENEGLVPALRQYLESLKTMPLLQAACERVTVDTDTTRDTLPFRVRVALYNIAREAILNMVRHSKIEQSEDGFGNLVISVVNNVLHVIIQDNGVGFSLEKRKNKSPCFGLRDMEFQLAVVRNMGRQAEIEFKSEPDHGTHIHVWTTLA